MLSARSTTRLGGVKLQVRHHRPLHELPAEKAGTFRELSEPYPAKWYGQKRDPVVRHESQDPDYLAEARMDAIPRWDPPDMPLADYECKHGKLPTDNNINCECWGRSIEQLPIDLRERVRGLSREDAVAALLAA